MPKKKISKEKSIRRTKHLTELIICMVCLAGGVFAVKGMVDRSSVVTSGEHKDKSEIIIQETSADPQEPFDPNKTLYETKNINTKDKFKGDLILVNDKHEYYVTGEEDLVSILDKNEETGRTYFGAVDNTYTVVSKMYEPMATMIGDFYDIYHIDNIIIYGAFRTTEFQKELYDKAMESDNEEDKQRVAKPGFSEHESGYAVDFSTIPDYDYQGTGDYAWFSENCYKYGLIIRYPEDKENITNIRYEPWHFRYVGKPHSYYMTKNGLCMEEYMDLLEQHPYSGEHLEFTDEDGRNFEVYFVPSDDGAETTSVPVPSGLKYEISGNNYNGFIVTVYKDEKLNAEEPPHEETQPEETQQEEETQAETEAEAEETPQE